MYSGVSSIVSFTGRLLYSDYIWSSSSPDGFEILIRNRETGALVRKSLETGENASDGEYQKIRIFKKQVCKYPLLNRIAAIPFIGPIAGIMRIGLSVIHVIGHLFLSIWNKEHIPHVIKGGFECLRGVIELIPVIGRIWTWHKDALIVDCAGQALFEKDHQRYYFEDSKSLGIKLVDSVRARYFLYKISNPNNMDHIDELLGGPGVDQYYFDREMKQKIEGTESGQILFTFHPEDRTSFQAFSNIQREWPDTVHAALFGSSHDGNLLAVKPWKYR